MATTDQPEMIAKLRQYAPADSGCWIWTGPKDANGYGRVGSTGLAHREVYEALVGPIPKGLHIDHLCRVTSCVNPEHLEPVTQAENNRRAAAAREVCRNGGHPLDGIRRNGEKFNRYCLTCNRLRVRGEGPLRSRALKVLRENRLTVLYADTPTDGGPLAPATLTARVQSSRGTGVYAVDLAFGTWTCTCREQTGCAHIAATQLVTGHAPAEIRNAA